MKKNVQSLSQEEKDKFLTILQTRFEENMKRHKDITWNDVVKKLKSKSEKIRSLVEMERTGGEPDVVGYDKKKNEYIFFDCSPESPAGRRSLCYDREALDSRKEAKPKNSAIDMADAFGVELLNEEEYRFLQTLGMFDLKTSSWINTPDDIRELGGAIFCDRRYDTVFLYHNGAESYYAARGFRGKLNV